MKGTIRHLLDPRDYSFTRSFGVTKQDLPPREYNYDLGIRMPDQNADGYRNGCTGYTQADIATDQDAIPYDPIFTYEKTCLIEGHGPERGCSIRNSAKTGIVYGMKGEHEENDAQALTHRRGAFYSVEKVSGCDWFDSMRLALRKSGTSISVGTLWFLEWGETASDGILTPYFYFDGKWDEESGHNYKICGEKTINGQPYLIAKPWLGKNFGDNGWCYFSRETFNKVFDIYGTIAIIQTRATPQDIITIRITILQFLILYLGRIINMRAYA